MRDRLPAIALVAAILVAWEAYVRLAGIEPVVLPAPSRIATALWDYRADAARHALPAIRRSVEPILVTSQTIPVIAIAPLFLLWFGFGLLPKILVVVLVTFFPIVVALLDGFGQASRDATDLLRSYGATDAQAFRKLRWPTALPSFFTGLRIAVVYAVIGAVFGEYVGAKEGLGIWMLLSQNAFRTDLVFAAIVVTSAVSLVLYWVVGIARRVAIPWAPGVRREPDRGLEPF